MKEKIFSAIAVIFFTLILKGGLFACSCLPLPPIYSAFEQANVVFIGKVISSNEPKTRQGDEEEIGDIIFDFEVIENFKGVKGRSIKLNRGPMSSSCYSGYAIGETYLIYAYNEGGTGFFSDGQKKAGMVYQGSFCNRSGNIRSAQDQIRFLREMAEGKPESQIYGSVRNYDIDQKFSDRRYTFLPKIEIVLTGPEKTFRTTTDEFGIFRFNNIPDGSYAVQPVQPEGYRVMYPGKENIEIGPDKIITVLGRYPARYPDKNFYIDFTFDWNNVVSGSVVDMNGKWIYRYAINLLPAAKPGEEIDTYVDGTGDPHSDGRFDRWGATPGRYLLAVDIYSPSGSEIVKRFFYPGVDSAAKAQVFDLGPTTQIKDLQFKLPLATRTINGSISWSDGTSAGMRGWTDIRKSEAKEIDTRFDWQPTEGGKFKFQIFEGLEYWLHTEVTYSAKIGGEYVDKTVEAKPVKIKIGDSPDEIKIIIPKPADFACNGHVDCPPISKP